jgi:hypothetical protein
MINIDWIKKLPGGDKYGKGRAYKGAGNGIGDITQCYV